MVFVTSLDANCGFEDSFQVSSAHDLGYWYYFPQIAIDYQMIVKQGQEEPPKNLG